MNFFYPIFFPIGFLLNFVIRSQWFCEAIEMLCQYQMPFLLRAIANFFFWCWQSSRNYLYKDLSWRNCIWYLFMFRRFFLSLDFFDYFSSMLRYLQAANGEHLYHHHPLSLGWIATHGLWPSVHLHEMSNSFFHVLASKAPAGISFKSILVLREYNACSNARIRFIGLSRASTTMKTLVPIFPLVFVLLWFFSNKRINVYTMNRTSTWKLKTYNVLLHWCSARRFVNLYFVHWYCIAMHINTQRTNMIW